VIELAEEPLTGRQQGARGQEAGDSRIQSDSRCPSEVHVDEAPGSWTLVALLLVAALGAWIGRSLILYAPDAARFTQDNKVALELCMMPPGNHEGLECDGCVGQDHRAISVPLAPVRGSTPRSLTDSRPASSGHVTQPTTAICKLAFANSPSVVHAYVEQLSLARMFLDPSFGLWP
jgi:hypothetical protein